MPRLAALPKTSRSRLLALASLLLVLLVVAVPGPARAQPPGSWVNRQPLNTLRTEVAGAVIAGRLHVVGGFPGGTGGPGAHEMYDPVTDTWSTLAPLPADLNHVAAVELNGQLYVVGGWNASLIPVNTLYRYSLGTNSWTTLEPMPTPRGALAAFGYQGHLYAIGGNMSSGGVGDTGVVEIYNPVTNTWAGGHTPMPAPRNHVMYGVLGGLLHVVGGRAAGISGAMTDHEAYNPTTDTWTFPAPLPTGRSGGGATVYKGRLHVLGGEGRNGPTFDENEAYDPASNTWTTLAPMPTSRHGLAVATIGDQLLAASGGPQPGATYSNVLQAFTLAVACDPRPRVSVQTSPVGGGRLQAQITATTSVGTPANRLTRLQATRLDNVAVDVRTLLDQRQPFSLELPDRPATVAVAVQRLAPGPFQAHLTVRDDCGDWSTLVGGGVGVP